MTPLLETNDYLIPDLTQTRKCYYELLEGTRLMYPTINYLQVRSYNGQRVLDLDFIATSMHFIFYLGLWFGYHGQGNSW